MPKLFNYNVGNTARKLEAIKNAHVMPVNENNNSRPSGLGNMNMNNMNVGNISPNVANPNPQKNLNLNQMLDNDQFYNKNNSANNNLGGTGNTFYKASPNLPRGTISANNIPVNNIK